MKTEPFFALNAEGERIFFILAAVLWVVIIGGSFLLNWHRAGEAAAELALVEARSRFHKDLVYRRWATIYGGVYVPPADHTPPNPYLTHIPDRDVVTTSGKRLTLVNPAYMTRQVHELGRESYGIQGHITSLHPIRPENEPDAWEREALKAFHAGTKEFSSFGVVSGQPSLRFMRPLVTEVACLKCHAEQGYRPGDIRGGISVSVPFTPYQRIAGRQQTQSALSHGVIGCLGLLGLWIGRRFVIYSRVALREREEWFRILFEEAPDAVFIETLDDRILDANAAATEMLGYTREEFRAMRVADLQAPEVRGETGGIIRDELARGDFFEGLDLRKDGTRVPIEVHNRQMHIQGRDLVLSIVRDITERKRAETALRESEEKYRLLFNNADMLISVWDREGVCQLMNRKLADLFGGEPETFVGQSFQDLHFETAEEYTERIRKAIDSGISREYEDRVGFPSGDRWLLSQVHPVLDTAGRIQYAQIIAHDISERKATENALRLANDIIVRSPVAAFVWQNETGWPVEYASANVEAIFGWSAEDFLSGKILYLNVIHPEDLERVTHEVAICSADSTQTRVSHQPYRIRRPDGNIRWIEDSTVIRRNEGGEVIAYEGILMDISARKQAEAEKARLEAQVRQSRKLDSIGRLAGGVAHDLNNLLSPILGYGEMLLEDAADTGIRREPVEEIVGAGRRARDLVRQLLAFSRKQTLEVKPLDLNRVLKDFESLIRRTIREDIDIRMIFGPDLPLVRGDIGQLEQVIMNLAVNARDAMPDGGELTIETRAVELDASYAKQHPGVVPGPYVLMGVSDTGCGMDADIREKMFEPFFTTKQKDQGAGLGLATVYGIVKQHRGNIWVYSEPGIGATFKVYLPVSEEATRADDPPASDRAEASRSGTETVLLAEDNRQVRELAEIILNREGYTVLSADSGKAALARLDHHEGSLHLLLTDVVMPGMNGRELYMQVADRYPGIKVVYMSGYTDNVIAHRGVMDSGIHFIQKPFSVKGLTTQVRDVLDGTGPFRT